MLVHPGEQEACGHVLREAAASGLPIVAPRSGAALDVVRHLETGYLYDPTDPWAFAEAVSAVVADPQRRRLGVHGRESVAARTWRDAVEELVEHHCGQRRPGSLTATSGTHRTLTRP